MSSTIRARAKTLPPLPKTVDCIREICQAEEVDLPALVDVLESDPMLTANILKVANSPFYGFSQEVASIDLAVRLFGPSMIRGFAVATTIRKYFQIDLSPYGITSAGLADISNLQRALVFRWMSRVDAGSLRVLSPASFMMEIGKIIIAQEILETGQSAGFLHEIEHSDDIAAVERAHVGIDGRELVAELFQHWRFENDLVEAIRHMGAPESAPEESRFFARVLGVIGMCISVKRVLAENDVVGAKELVSSYGLKAEVFASAAAAIADSLHEVRP